MLTHQAVKNEGAAILLAAPLASLPRNQNSTGYFVSQSVLWNVCRTFAERLVVIV
jgi:hypothetical protein